MDRALAPDPPLRFGQFRVGEGNLSYLIGDATSSRALLVDPEAEGVEAYDAFRARHGLELMGVVDTHTHADHVSAGADLAAAAGVPYLMHTAAESPRVTRRVVDGDEIAIGGAVSARILTVPGHTPDLMALVLADRVLTGDSLFIGGCGRTDLPGGSTARAFASLARLANLDDALFVFPGHDYRGRTHSTIGAERATNPALRARSVEELAAIAYRPQAPAPRLLTESLAANTH